MDALDGGRHARQDFAQDGFGGGEVEADGGFACHTEGGTRIETRTNSRIGEGTERQEDFPLAPSKEKESDDSIHDDSQLDANI